MNRPLLLSDSLDKNLNKTIYRNQVNKVANAIREIISALKNPVPQKTLSYLFLANSLAGAGNFVEASPRLWMGVEILVSLIYENLFAHAG